MSSFTDATGAPGIKCIVPTGLSLTANYETICTGQSATLTALAVNADYYSINGSNWQASPVFKVSPTSNASYTLYAKTSDECSASLTNAATVAVNSIPSVPLTPTHNGPKCAGTGITFSASLPGGATGLDWTGSVSGQGTSKTTATTAGNYSAQVRSYLTSGTTCYSEWTSTVSSTTPAITSVPYAAHSLYGPKCAGTGITFSATKPADATGLDWTGSVSGQGTSKTTATTAGNYSAQVRSYLTSAGTTCYSGWTGSVSATINGLAGRDQANNGCCASGLTACNGYCRDLAADRAVCYNNREIREICVGNDFAVSCGTEYTLTAFSRNETMTILQRIWNERSLGHTSWTGEIGSGCRYVCTRTECNICTTGSGTSYGWLGYR
jgi:hypothetical protein